MDSYSEFADVFVKHKKDPNFMIQNTFELAMERGVVLHAGVFSV